ncbi:hypothetical protein PAMA_008009 [Pampus argenteus]
MPLKNSNAVALERRMDLASLFCMIGRHGPAVALAVIVMVSVLAGFIIYRTVRGKRRKATAAADGTDSKSPGAEGDASVMQPGQEPPGPEEPHSSVESTDVSDEGSSHVLKEDADLIQSDPKIRQRRVAAAAAAAAAKKPPLCSLPKSDIQVPDNKHIASYDTDDMAVMRDAYKVTRMYTEEANESLQSDTYTVAETEVEDAVDWHRRATDDGMKDEEEIRDIDSCMKEPQPINDESCQEEEEKVFKAEYQEDEDVTIDEDVSDKKTKQEEENNQCARSSPLCFEQTLHMSANDDNDKLQDNKPTLETDAVESNLEEPVMHTEDEDEKRHLGSIDYSNNNLSTEEEKKNEAEDEVEESVDYQVIDQQTEIGSSTFEQETTPPSSQQGQCDHVTDVVAPPIRDSECDDEDGLGEALEEDTDKDHTNDLTAVEELQIEQKEENGLRCNQEVAILPDRTVEETILTSDDTAACGEEHDSLSMALSPVLPCLSEPVKVDHFDDGLSSVATDAKAQISSIADFPDSSSDCQQAQKADKITATLDGDTDSANVGPQLPSHKTDNQPESNEYGITAVLVEEWNDRVYESHVSSCCKDQQSIQKINNDAFDIINVTASPDTDTHFTASVIAEEISCPHLPSICQDGQGDGMEIHETFDKTRVNTSTEVSACDRESIAATEMSEEISQPDMLVSSQDQQSGQTQNAEDFSEVTTDAAPPMCQLHLLSFEQSALRDSDISSTGFGEESGISSMTVSPDLQDAGNDFDMSHKMPVMDCEEQTKAQNSFFTDDVAISVKEGMVFGPYPSDLSQQPPSEHTDRADYESFAANEDMFGHEIEDKYQIVVDQFAVNVTSLTAELKTQSDVKAVVDVVEIKEKKEAVSAEKKEATEEEKEKDEDYEKTEISIMEATMDNNEWITDSNYQVLPWMNPSVPSLAQDHTKTTQLPIEEGQHSSSLADATSIDTDTPPSTDIKQTSTLPLVEENTENNKKVVAVQPMPQNVNVVFRIHYLTQSPYQTVAIMGNQQELGNWKDFIPLERAKDGHWTTVVSLPAESHVEWKFVVVEKGEVCRWEECGNRVLDTGYGDDLLVHKWWGFL